MKDKLIPSSALARRQFLRDFAVALAVVPAAAIGCGGKKLTCTDVSTLTPEEQQQRTTLLYVDTAKDPAKKCDACSLFKPAAPDQCGSCTAIKGPIHPQGGCNAWVAKT